MYTSDGRDACSSCTYAYAFITEWRCVMCVPWLGTCSASERVGRKWKPGQFHSIARANIQHAHTRKSTTRCMLHMWTRSKRWRLCGAFTWATGDLNTVDTSEDAARRLYRKCVNNYSLLACTITLANSLVNIWLYQCTLPCRSDLLPYTSFVYLVFTTQTLYLCMRIADTHMLQLLFVSVTSQIYLYENCCARSHIHRYIGKTYACGKARRNRHQLETFRGLNFICYIWCLRFADKRMRTGFAWF